MGKWAWRSTHNIQPQSSWSLWSWHTSLLSKVSSFTEELLSSFESRVPNCRESYLSGCCTWYSAKLQRTCFSPVEIFLSKFHRQRQFLTVQNMGWLVGQQGIRHKAISSWADILYNLRRCSYSDLGRASRRWIHSPAPGQQERNWPRELICVSSNPWLRATGKLTKCSHGCGVQPSRPMPHFSHLKWVLSVIQTPGAANRDGVMFPGTLSYIPVLAQPKCQQRHCSPYCLNRKLT